MKLHTRAAPFAAVIMLALGACGETGEPSADALPAMREAPTSDETACVNAVAAQSGNTATVLSSETSEANNLVMVGVGPDLAPWRCLVKDGVVSEAMFSGSEGAA